MEIQENVTELDEDVAGLDQDVNFLFDEQVIQDARIFTLKQTSIYITADVESVTLQPLSIRELKVIRKLKV